MYVSCLSVFIRCAAQMFMLQFKEKYNTNDMQMCEACYIYQRDRGVPPPGRTLRPWPSEYEVVDVDMRHPQVFLGLHLVEVAQDHAAAHTSVGKQLAKELHEWGFDVANFDDTSDVLVAMMRRFRSSKHDIQYMVQRRIQVVASARGYESSINFHKADYDKLKQVRWHDCMSCSPPCDAPIGICKT